MSQMFRSLSDVEAYVRQHPGDGKGFLRVQLALGIFGDDSRPIAEEWLANEEAREVRVAAERREQEDRELRTREVHAVEVQAAAAREATRIAWIALGVSAIGVFIAIVALVK